MTMDDNKKKIMEMRVQKTVEALKKNGMEAMYAPTRKEAIEQVAEYLEEGQLVTCGGSMTLEECGIMNLLRSGLYEFLDRSASGTTPDKVEEIYRMAFCADAYLTSSNAITEQGELFNVDGNCNRVAAMLYGPKSVIVVAGYNKIVANLDEAVLRLKKVAAPANCIRLNRDTYCAHTGECKGVCGSMAEGCSSPDRICAGYTVIAKQQPRYAGRIKVILVGEELGY